MRNRQTVGPHTHRVIIADFKFDPEVLWVEPGDSVEWVNKDIAPHTATARDADWDTGELNKGGRRIVAFPEAGRFAYFCAYHPQMTGEVVVIRS